MAGSAWNEGLRPPRSQCHYLATTRSFLLFQIAMNRLKVIAELLRVSLTNLTNFAHEAIHLRCPPRTAVLPACKSLAAHSRARGRPIRCGPAGPRPHPNRLTRA